MVLLHPAILCKPAICAAIELETGLRSDVFETRAGNYLVGLVNPHDIRPRQTTPQPKAKPAQRVTHGQDPFGGNAA